MLRWLIAAAILGVVVWRLEGAWSGLDTTVFVIHRVEAALAALTAACALLTLAALSGAGVRAAGLPGPGAPLWPFWFRVWFQSYFFRYVPGKVVLVIERVRLGESLGIPRATSVVLVVWESFLLLAGAGILAGGGLLLRPPAVDGLVSQSAIGGLATAALLGSLALWPLLRIVVDRVPALRARVPGLVLSVPPLAQVALAVGNAGAWGLLGASFALTCRALDGGATVDPTMLVVWFVASYVVGQVTSVAPAGLGVREGLLVAGLAGLAPGPLALAWAVAHRILLSVVEILLVAASQLIPFPKGPGRG